MCREAAVREGGAGSEEVWGALPTRRDGDAGAPGRSLGSRDYGADRTQELGNGQEVQEGDGHLPGQCGREVGSVNGRRMVSGESNSRENAALRY